MLPFHIIGYIVTKRLLRQKLISSFYTSGNMNKEFKAPLLSSKMAPKKKKTNGHKKTLIMIGSHSKHHFKDRSRSRVAP